MLSPTTTPAVEVRDAAVTIGGRPVLRRIELQVAPGEFVALMGANGSGKSTLVRAMTGLLPLARGSVHLWGTPLKDFHDHHRVGFVPQRPGAGGGVPASVREVVSSGRLTRRGLLRRAGRRDRAAVDEALEVVGLADRAHEGVANLSGGQQQRVLIARALAGEPDLFFLDEPTAGVDLGSQEALATTLAALAARGSTVVLVAHELGPLAPLVQRTVVLRDGRVVHDGAPLAADAAVALHEAHSHAHCHDLGRPGQDPREHGVAHDHAPHVAAPLEAP